MNIITLTDAATNQLIQYMTTTNTNVLKLQIAETGCTGWQHSLVEHVGSFDGVQITSINDSLKIVIEEEQIPLISGTVVDYVTEGLNSQFIYSNPRAGDYCGCGMSFQLNT